MAAVPGAAAVAPAPPAPSPPPSAPSPAVPAPAPPPAAPAMAAAPASADPRVVATVAATNPVAPAAARAPAARAIRRLDVASPVPADIDIANAVQPLHIADIAAELGIPPEHYDLYGKYKAKVLLSVLDQLQGQQDGYYVVVGGITPTLGRTLEGQEIV